MLSQKKLGEYMVGSHELSNDMGKPPARAKLLTGASRELGRKFNYNQTAY